MDANWTYNILHNSLGLKPGERVLTLVDEPLSGIGDALCRAAMSLGAAEASQHVLARRHRHLAVVSEKLLQKVRRADVIVSMISSLEFPSEAAVLQASLAAFREENRGRWAFGTFIDHEMLTRELMADLDEVALVGTAFAAQLKDADWVRLVSRAGTDLSFRLGDRPIHADTGRLLTPGSFGNLPFGEVYVAPVEESANGRLVVDISIGGTLLEYPVTLTFRNGKVVKVDGTRELPNWLGYDPWAWTLGEFGIGTNPAGIIRGRAPLDEKVLGTAHIALGGNRTFGGRNAAAIHLDFVFHNPDIFLDGRLMSRGMSSHV